MLPSRSRALSHRRYRALLLACALGAPVASADTLEDWLAAIDATNPAVRAAYQRWQAAETLAARVSGLPDPMIGADLERMNTRLDDYAMIEYMAEQELPWFGKRGADARVAELEAEAVGFDYLETRRVTRSRITEAYWMLWEARNALDVARESVQLAEQTEAIARARQEAGQSLQTDLLRAAIERVRLDNERVSIERRIGVAQADLNALLHAPPGTPRETEREPRLPAFDRTLEQLQESATMYCCTLVGAIRRKEAREALQRAARLEGRPMVSLRVEARQPEGGSSVEAIDTGVFLTVPWLWRGKYKAVRAAAHAELQMAQAQLDEEINETLAMVQRLYTKAEAHHRTRALYEETLVPQAKALVDSSREAYQSGTLSALELINAQRMYQDALMILYRETAAYAATQAALMAQAAPWTEDELATGLPPHE